ncbi:uncharacterized protein [Diadema setosum]|uniref:uncharacterized protein n=1 Tax=Diadema setosum TaxID=31175 RepID=UPI003B3A12B3
MPKHRPKHSQRKTSRAAASASAPPVPTRARRIARNAPAPSTHREGTTTPPPVSSRSAGSAARSPADEHNTSRGPGASTAVRQPDYRVQTEDRATGQAAGRAHVTVQPEQDMGGAVGENGEYPNEGLLVPWPTVTAHKVNEMSLIEVDEQGQSLDTGFPKPPLMSTPREELGATVPISIKEKIWKGEFVDLGCLLKNALIQSDQTPVVLTYSGAALQLQPQRKVPGITTIEQWTSAFTVKHQCIPRDTVPGRESCSKRAFPSAGTGGGFGTRSAAYPSLGDLQQEWSDLMDASRARNTQAVYHQAQEAFSKFISIYFPGSYTPCSYEQVALFISYLSLQGYAASTIVTYVSGLSFHLRAQGLPDVTKHFVVSRLLDGCWRYRSRADSRCPITISILKKVLSCLPALCTSYDSMLFPACFLVAFFGFLRVGEFTSASRPTAEVSLRADDVAVCGLSPERHIRIFIRSSKTDQLGRGCYIMIPEAPGNPICPVRAVCIIWQ